MLAAVIMAATSQTPGSKMMMASTLMTLIMISSLKRWVFTGQSWRAIADILSLVRLLNLIKL